MNSPTLKVRHNDFILFNFLGTIGLGKDCSTESVSHDFNYMHQEKSMLSGNKLGRWYNFAFVTRWLAFITIALMSLGKPRTSYCLFWIFDLLMLGFSIVCLKTFMNFAGILIIIEEFLLLLWHFIIFLFFVDAPDNGYEFKTVRFWMVVVLICYLLCMLIEIILLFLGGKMCFKPTKTAGNVQQAPVMQNTDEKPNHFKVELPDSAKATLKSNA